jgi:hypothetical protein
VGGDSFGSQNELKKCFGLGAATFADVEVLWGGPNVNCLLSVDHGQVGKRWGFYGECLCGVVQGYNVYVY